MKLLTWLAIGRFFLEMLGGGLLLCMVAFWAFPGAWTGLGIGVAIQAKQAGVRADVSVLSPADLAAVSLAVATIVLGAVAFFITVAAFLGFSEIRNLAERTAKDSTRTAVAELQAFQAQIVKDIETAMRRSQDRIDVLLNSRTASEEQLEATGLSGQGDAEAIARASSGLDTR